MQTVKCPHCSKQISDDASLGGKVVNCPHCRAQFKMPGSAIQEPKWFVVLDKKKLGPFARAQLKAMASSGQVIASTMVLREGEQRWTPANSVEGVIPATQAIPVAKFAPPLPRQQEIGTGDPGSKSGKSSVNWPTLARETLSKRPWLTAGVGGVAAMIVLGIMIFGGRKEQPLPPREKEAQAVASVQPSVPTNSEKKADATSISFDQPPSQVPDKKEQIPEETLPPSREKQVQPLAKVQRAKLFLDLENRRSTDLAGLKAEEARLVEIGKKLAQQQNNYRDVDPFNARALNAYNAYMKDLSDLNKEVTAVRDQLHEKVKNYEQERRSSS